MTRSIGKMQRRMVRERRVREYGCGATEIFVCREVPAPMVSSLVLAKVKRGRRGFNPRFAA